MNNRRAKRVTVGLVLAAFLAWAAAVSMPVRATSTPPAARGSVLIRHAYFGCHVWSANGDRAAAEQRLAIRAGGVITVVNHDNCRHTLVQVSGPTGAWIGNKVGVPTSGRLVAYGAPVSIRLALPGTYVFTTVEGSHGLTMLERAGDAALAPDNELMLTVTVLPTID